PEHRDHQSFPTRRSSDLSILSNISRGGRTEDLTSLLVDEFGHKKGHTYGKELRQLALELTEYLDRIHNFSLDELGLDLAIDQTGDRKSTRLNSSHVSISY